MPLPCLVKPMLFFLEPLRGIAFQNPICQGQTMGPFRQEPLTSTFTADQWQLYQTINLMDLRSTSKITHEEDGGGTE